jgi:hypothetical protein
MLSKKLLEDIGVDMFPRENGHRQHKSVAQSACITSFCPLAIMLGPGHHLVAFHIKNKAPTGAGACADLRGRSVQRKALSDELVVSDVI